MATKGTSHSSTPGGTFTCSLCVCTLHNLQRLQCVWPTSDALRSPAEQGNEGLCQAEKGSE